MNWDGASTGWMGHGGSAHARRRLRVPRRGISDIFTGTGRTARQATNEIAFNQASAERMLREMQASGRADLTAAGATGRADLAAGATAGQTFLGDTLSALTGQIGGASARFDPYAQAGAGALDPLAARSAGGFRPADFAGDPGYQFALEQGLAATQGAAGVRGSPFGGNAQAAMSQFATGLASQTYNDAFSRWQTETGNLQQLAGLGMEATGAQGNLAQVLSGLTGQIGGQQADLAATTGARQADLASVIGQAQGNLAGQTGGNLAQMLAAMTGAQSGVRQSEMQTRGNFWTSLFS
jgi:hypothetical protein